MKKLMSILIFGVAVRIFLSFASFHPDIAALSAGGQNVADGHILNLYDYSSDTLVLNYPPLVYWFFGLLNFLFNGNLSLLKLSYMLFDIPLGFLLIKAVDPKKAVLAFSLWMFNPISLYATYMMGQFDIIPTFFTILSFYFIAKNRLSWAALALGGGIAFKLYPIFLIIPLIILANTFRSRIKLIILAVLPYCISILPYIFSHSFRANALFASQSSKSLYATLPISGGESIILFPVLLMLFYLLIWPARPAGGQKKLDELLFWKIYLIPLLLFFIFTHYHPQWLIWITPFLILNLVFERLKNLLPMLMIVGSWVGSLFFFDSSLTIGLFAPLFPVLKNTADIWTLLNFNIDYNFSRSILQTVFASSAVYLIYQYFPRKENG